MRIKPPKPDQPDLTGSQSSGILGTAPAVDIDSEGYSKEVNQIEAQSQGDPAKVGNRSLHRQASINRVNSPRAQFTQILHFETSSARSKIHPVPAE